MLDLAEARDMTVDANVVRRVGKDHLCLFAVEQPLIGLRIRCVASDQAMRADLPDVAEARDSGALVDLKAYGLETEPLVRRSIRAGVACACFSGDKLIGGPQSGVIVGGAEYIQRMRKNPLIRAFRCGKLTLAAMEATLKLFLMPEKIEERHPLYRMLSLKTDKLERRARRVANRLKRSLPAGVEVSVEDGKSQVGSGSVPVEEIPTKLLALRSDSSPSDDLAKRLRRQIPAVFTRIHTDAVLFDFRTIRPEEDGEIIEAIRRLFTP